MPVFTDGIRFRTLFEHYLLPYVSSEEGQRLACVCTGRGVRHLPPW